MPQKKKPLPKRKQDTEIKDFFDMTAPGAIKFFVDRENVTLHIYSRAVDNIEQRKILQNAARKNKLQSTSEDVQESSPPRAIWKMW